MFVPRRSIPLLALAVLLIACWVAGTQAQVPDKFTNLQVLPKDIGKRELLSTMHGFTDGLGVRCLGCHVPGPNPNSLEGADFASDKPETKKTARQMMKMTAAINKDFIAKMGLDAPPEVRCITCHRGVKEPKTLDQVLLEVAEKDSVKAAEDRYRELRTQYYGSGSYDFSAETLESVAQSLAEKNNFEGAVAMAQLNLEFYADDAMAHATLAQIYAAQGKTEDAVKSYERAIELSPDNPRLKQMLDKLRSGK